MTATPGAGSVRIGHAQVSVHHGDITSRLGEAAVVSSDDNYLSHGGGVSAAIWTAVGPALSADPAVQAVLRDGMRPRVGDVVVSHTADGALVLHAITLDFDRGERIAAERLGALYQRVLDTALDEGARTIALPLLATGAAGAHRQDSAAMLGRALRSRALLPLRLDVELWSIDGWVVDEAEPILAESARPPVEFAALAHSHADVVQEAARLLDEAGYDDLLTRTLVLFKELAPHLEAAMDSPARGTVRRAVEARNRLVSYTTSESEIPLVCDVLRGCVELMRPVNDNKHPWTQFLSSSLLTRPSFEDEVITRLTLEPTLDSWAPGDEGLRTTPSASKASPAQLNLLRLKTAGLRTTPSTSKASPVPPMSGSQVDDDLAVTLEAALHGVTGTSHVRSLHMLLLRTLSDDVLDAEHRRLQALGYRGDMSSCLLESCVHEDPRDVVLHLFSGLQLRTVLDQLRVPHEAADPPVRLASRLLTHLGFPLGEDAVDPRVLRAKVEVYTSEVGRLDLPGLTGRVAAVSQDLEQLLRLYARFLSQGILHVAPDLWLADRYPDQNPTLSRLTLGQLVHLVRDLGKEIDTSDSSQVRLRADALRTDGEVTWMPKAALALVHSRNVWVHGRDDAGERNGRPLAELRAAAQRFFSSVDTILAKLLDGPFPTVVVVDEVTYDRWGRLRITGRTSAGTNEEIFTDQTLQSGETYLMHSQTNPLRIDPILVPSGRFSDGRE